MSVIGILGGMGPHAGLDLHRKVLDQVQAEKDQEYPSVVHVSFSAQIADRTGFLSGNTRCDPAEGMMDSARRLAMAGARVIGMPCNTAHHPRFYERVARCLHEIDREIRFLNMPEETAHHLKDHYPGLRAGLLATNGTWQSGIYDQALDDLGLSLVLPDEAVQYEQVHRSIYDPGFGIKCQPDPVHEKARDLLRSAIDHLVDKGAEVILLACTELPLAMDGQQSPVSLVDPTLILARALVREALPERLKP